MDQTDEINKKNIIIPISDEDFQDELSREELLKNLAEITPKDLDIVAEGMWITEEERLKEEETAFSEHSKEMNEFAEKIEQKKPKNLLGFCRKDCRLTLNWETLCFVVLYDYTRNYENSFSGLEYWTKIFVKVWNFETEKEFVYRDAYDWNNDDWSKAYTKIKRLEIRGDTLKIWLWKNKGTSTLYRIKIPKNRYAEKSTTLSQIEQDEFRKYVESEKERLLKELTKNERYPNIFWYGARQLPNLAVTDIPFDQAIIADEYTDISSGESYILIKTQIDADSSKWKQYSWIKYKISINKEKLRYWPFINSLETKQIAHFDVREENLVNWLQVKINAKE